MKALVYHGARDLRVEEFPDPRPGPNEVAITVRACGICGSDLHAVLKPTPRRQPGIVMGHEFVGEVVELGPGARRWKVGDRVAAQPLTFCGRCEFCRSGNTNLCPERKLYGMTPGMPGGYAERVVVAEDRLFELPEGVSWEMGAVAEPLAVAVHAVSRGPQRPARSVAVVGCGTIGMFTLAALAHRRPDLVVAIDLVDWKLALAEELGARAFRADQPGLEDAVRGLTGGGADWVVEAVGLAETAALAIRLARPGGHVTWIGNAEPSGEIPFQNVVVAEKTVAGSYGYTDGDFGRALDLLAEGRVPRHWLSDQPVGLDAAPEEFIALAEGRTHALKSLLVGTGRKAGATGM